MKVECFLGALNETLSDSVRRLLTASIFQLLFTVYADDLYAHLLILTETFVRPGRLRPSVDRK